MKTCPGRQKLSRMKEFRIKIKFCISRVVRLVKEQAS